MRRLRVEPQRRIDAAALHEHRLPQPVEAKAAAALPVHLAGDTAPLAFHHLPQTGRAVRYGVLANLDADVAAAHLVGHGGGGAAAEKGIEHEVARVGCKRQDALDEPFGFGGGKNVTIIESFNFFFRFLIVANFVTGPYCFRYRTLLDFRKKDF